MRLQAALTSAIGFSSIPSPSSELSISWKSGANLSSTLTHHLLTDTDRPDPFNTSHPRRLMISRFDPVPFAECSPRVHSRYMSARLSGIVAERYSPAEFPSDFFADVTIATCHVEDPSPDHSGMNNFQRGIEKDTAPLVLLSPGFGAPRSMYAALALTISSHNFTVVTVDHPYDAAAVEFPDGSIVYRSADDTRPQDYVDVRVRDLQFVLDTLGVSSTSAKAMVVGHSLGGAAALEAMKSDARIGAGVVLDNPLFGTVVDDGVGSADGQSVLLWGNETTTPNSDPSWVKFSKAMKKRIDDGMVDFYAQAKLKGSAHYSYTDLPLLVDLMGVRDSLGDLGFIGTVKGERLMEVMGTFLGEYFRWASGTGGDLEIFKHVPAEFADVDILQALFKA